MSSFDKFMDDIVARENAAKRKSKIISESEDKEMNAQRQIRKLYQERPQNRIIWGKK